jgi:tRNA(Ile)-lysidine synthase
VPIAAAAVTIDLGRPGRYEVPAWGGCLVVEVVIQGGIEPSRLRQVCLRAREGGEDFQAALRATPRSLKKQFQARRLPAWQRGGPLVFDGAALLFVPGLGVDARCLAAPGARQLGLRWEPLAPG